MCANTFYIAGRDPGYPGWRWYSHSYMAATAARGLGWSHNGHHGHCQGHQWLRLATTLLNLAKLRET
jgi:hypothetical protein